jgi:hypothetical protein
MIASQKKEGRGAKLLNCSKKKKPSTWNSVLCKIILQE